MDDQRPQRTWETHKAWLEEADRTKQALQGIDIFSKQVHFVRRRGQVSKMCFFETAQEKKHDQTHANAALDLSGSLGRRVAEVLKAIPMNALHVTGDGCRVCIPAVSFLPEESDVEPLRYEGRLVSGGALPSWLKLDQSTGEFSATERSMTEDLHIHVDMYHSEGLAGNCQLIITPQRPLGSAAPWMVATGAIIARFSDLVQVPLEGAVRSVLQERLADIYDFNLRGAKNISLGQWLRIIKSIQRMLRSTAVAHITPVGRNQRSLQRVSTQ